MSIWPRHHQPERSDPDEEIRKTETAMRQLERAELYIVSAINLELGSPELRRALGLLHGHLLEVHDLLCRPHLAR